MNLLLHDGQYTDEEYRQRVGWGHSSIEHADRFADLADASDLVLIQHDPDRSDDMIQELVASAARGRQRGSLRAASEGMVLEI